MLQKTADFSAVLTVAITDGEEVAMLEAHYVGRGDVRVLVCFVWVVSCYATFCCKRKFGYNIADFTDGLLHLYVLWRCFLDRAWNRCCIICDLNWKLNFGVVRLDALASLALPDQFRVFVTCTLRS